jgi:hypothetical protein
MVKKEYEEVRQQNSKAIKSGALLADHWPGSAFSLSNLQIAISKLICPASQTTFSRQDSCQSTFRRLSCQSNFQCNLSAVNNA